MSMSIEILPNDGEEVEVTKLSKYHWIVYSVYTFVDPVREIFIEARPQEVADGYAASVVQAAYDAEKAYEANMTPMSWLSDPGDVALGGTVEVSAALEATIRAQYDFFKGKLRGMESKMLEIALENSQAEYYLSDWEYNRESCEHCIRCFEKVYPWLLDDEDTHA